MSYAYTPQPHFVHWFLDKSMDNSMLLQERSKVSKLSTQVRLYHFEFGFKLWLNLIFKCNKGLQDIWFDFQKVEIGKSRESINKTNVIGITIGRRNRGRSLEICDD